MFKNTLMLLTVALGLAGHARGVSARTITFSLPERVINMEVRLPDQKDAIVLTLERENFGNTVDLRPGTYSATIGSLGKTAQFVIPEKGFSTCFLLTFVSEGSPLAIVPVPDDSKNIPFGSYHIVNALNREVAVQFDKQKVLLRPGKSNTFPMPKQGDSNGLFRIKMATLIEGKSQPTQFFTSFCPCESERRYISLIYQDPQFTLPRVRSVPDFKISGNRGSVATSSGATGTGAPP